MHTSFTTRYYYHRACNLKQRVLALLEMLPKGETVLSISIFAACESDESYHTELTTIKEHIRSHLEYLPLTTYIIQPPAHRDGMAMEVHSLTTESRDIAVIEQPNGMRYIPVTLPWGELFLVEGVVSKYPQQSMYEQSRELFERVSTLLTSLELTPSNIIRQWNYIGNITEVSDSVQHYQGFNDARSSLYAMESWSDGYPAATGIGASNNTVVVSLIACRCNDKSDTPQIIRAINNPLQIAAHSYNKRVLIGEELSPKTTPKFERAKSLILDESTSICFISGTAAIRGEDSLAEYNAERQTLLTLENIEYLISDKNMIAHNSTARALKPATFRVYIKRREDFDSVRRIVEQRYPDLPTLFVEADVCRDELLVEIEGIAKGGVL